MTVIYISLRGFFFNAPTYSVKKTLKCYEIEGGGDIVKKRKKLGVGKQEIVPNFFVFDWVSLILTTFGFIAQNTNQNKIDAKITR